MCEARNVRRCLQRQQFTQDVGRGSTVIDIIKISLVNQPGKDAAFGLFQADGPVSAERATDHRHRVNCGQRLGDPVCSAINRDFREIHSWQCGHGKESGLGPQHTRHREPGPAPRQYRNFEVDFVQGA